MREKGALHEMITWLGSIGAARALRSLVLTEH